MIISVFMKESRYSKINIKDKIVKNKKIIFIFIIIICIVTMDQIIKNAIVKNIYNSTINIIQGFVNLTYVENTGGAYGIGSNSIATFVIISVIVLALLTKFVLCKKNELGMDILISISLILAGGISNLIDRVFRGFVVDYVDINLIFNFPIFNLADICVVVGCIVMGISIIITNFKDSKLSKDNTSIKEK